MKLRLDKYLSNMGRGSRNEIKADIRRGKVTVNGVTAKTGSLQVDSETDRICHKGERVAYQQFLYLMLHKPAGYVSATEDQVHPTVIDLVPEQYRHYDLFPVGRLDLNTTGLLLITNDGEFSHRVTSPVSGIEKLYLARISRELSDEDEAHLLAGVNIETKRGSVICKAKSVIANGRDVEITITEGKFHQVKKMFETVGATVVELARKRIGGLWLDDALSPGETRTLSESEILSIFETL